jgi:xylose isomerase
MMTGADNLGATLDIGHAIYGGERAAQAAALLHRADRLFYVHLNDNDGHWDWDMMPGVYHPWAFVEFFYTLKQLGYEDDWYAFDVFSKEHSPVETFNAAMSLTRKLEAVAGRLDGAQLDVLMQERNPAKTMTYLYGLAFQDE